MASVRLGSETYDIVYFEPSAEVCRLVGGLLTVLLYSHHIYSAFSVCLDAPSHLSGRRECSECCSQVCLRSRVRNGQLVRTETQHHDEECTIGTSGQGTEAEHAGKEQAGEHNQGVQGAGLSLMLGR